MKKIRLGIYIEDSEYGDRLTCYFMNHYKDQLEIHMYTMKEQLEHLEGEIDIMLSSELDQWNNKYIPLIQIVEETPIESEEGILCGKISGSKPNSGRDFKACGR